MSNINILLNYYIQNDYLNLTNNINIPNNFKYIDLIKEKFSDTNLNVTNI